MIRLDFQYLAAVGIDDIEYVSLGQQVNFHVHI